MDLDDIVKVISSVCGKVVEGANAGKGLEARMKKELGKHPLIAFSYDQGRGLGYFAIRGPKKVVKTRIKKLFKAMDLKQKSTWTNKAAPDLHFFQFKV